MWLAINWVWNPVRSSISMRKAHLDSCFEDRDWPWRGGATSHQKVGKGALVICFQAIEFLKQYILGSLMLVKPDVQAS